MICGAEPCQVQEGDEEAKKKEIAAVYVDGNGEACDPLHNATGLLVAFD